MWWEPLWATEIPGNRALGPEWWPRRWAPFSATISCSGPSSVVPGGPRPGGRDLSRTRRYDAAMRHLLKTRRSRLIGLAIIVVLVAIVGQVLKAAADPESGRWQAPLS